MPIIHELKCWPEHLQRIINRQKTFEIRVNDRDFQDGDFLCLREYFPELGGKYGPAWALVKVIWVFNDPRFHLKEHVTMSIELIDSGEEPTP